MRFIFGLFVLLLFVSSCSNSKEATVFLQQQEVAIAQPRITASSLIIDSSVTVTANLRLDGVKLYYTHDGTSLRYTKPLVVKKEGKYTFKAFHPDWIPSETAELKLYKKGHILASIDWFSKANNIYPGEGINTLINQKKASLNFRDSQWVGFDSIVNAQVFFKQKTFIKSISIGFLVDPKSWIFPPSEITFYLNDADSIHIKVANLIDQVSIKMRDITIPIEKELDSVRIKLSNVNHLPDWHLGKGNKAWLFMDEWIFN